MGRLGLLPCWSASRGCRPRRRCSRPGSMRCSKRSPLTEYGLARRRLSFPVGEFEARCATDGELATLRTSIRDFLAADRDGFGWKPAVDSWLARWDAGFS